jgi:5'-methylthioinosine phosphorylase
MSKLAIIGGSGLNRMESLQITREQVIQTPFGLPSAPLTWGMLGGREVVFLPRHGAGHTIAPHKINYRANLWALQHVGIEQVIGAAAVGGIRHDMGPLTLVIPDQLIDYTYDRAHTFFEQDSAPVTHIDFTQPYCEFLRQALQVAARALNEPVMAEGSYAATQGPRLETAREVQRLERDGCDIVGMTGMPEAALARELGLCYACCALVVNWAAGKEASVISLQEIEHHLHIGMERMRRVLAQLIATH